MLGAYQLGRAVAVAVMCSSVAAWGEPACPRIAGEEPARVVFARTDTQWVSDWTYDAASSSDGRFVATRSFSHGLAVWDERTGMPLVRTRAPDGLMRWGDDALYVTDIAKGATTRIALADGAVASEHVARFPVPGGTSLVATARGLEQRDGNDHAIRTLILPGQPRALVLVRGAPNGVVAAVIAKRDGSTGELLATSSLVLWPASGPAREIALGAGAITSVELLPSRGEAIVAVAPPSGPAVPWLVHVAGGTPQRLDNLEHAAAIAVAPSGDRFAYVDQDIGVYDLSTKRVLWTAPFAPTVPMASVLGLAFADRYVFAVGFAEAARYDATTGRLVSGMGNHARNRWAMFRGEDSLVTGLFDRITTWDLGRGEVDARRSLWVNNFAVEVHDGDLIVSRRGHASPYVNAHGDQCVNPTYLDRWTKGFPPADLDDAIAAEPGELDHIDGAPVVPPVGAARVPICGDDPRRFGQKTGRRLVSTDDHNGQSWLDLATGHRTPLDGWDLGSISHATGQDAQQYGDYAAAIHDGAVSIWDARGKRRSVALPATDFVQRDGFPMAARDDGRTLAVSYGQRIIVIDLPNAAATATFEMDAFPTALRYVGGDLLVGLSDGTLRRLASDGHELERAATGAAGWLSIEAISPSGRRLVIGDTGGDLQIWATQPMRRLVTLLEDADGEWLAVTPGGAFTGSPDAARMFAVAFASPPSAVSGDDYAAVLRRPDLVRARLAGRNDDLALRVPRPPSVTIATPPAWRDGRVHVEATIASSVGQGIAAVFADGHEVAHASYCGSAAAVVLDVPVEPGTRRLALIANDDRGVTSAPVAIEAAIPASPRPPEIWAVLVGIGAYPALDDRWQLHADRDARALANAVSAMAGPGKRYAAAHVTLLVDADASPNKVDAALAQLNVVKPGDAVIVSFAGHGMRTANGTSVLVTSAASLANPMRNAIGWDQLRARLEAIPAPVLVLLDACHAGAFSQDVTLSNDRLAAGLARGVRTNVVVFAAAKGRQYSYEVGASRGHFELAAAATQRAKHSPAKRPVKPAPPPAPPAGDRDAPVGVFTTAVIAAFASAATDVDQDGAIEVDELVDAVTAKVIADTQQQQTPIAPQDRSLVGNFVVGMRL